METPKILIIGGLNLLFVHDPVTDYFLQEGVLAKLVPYSESLCWLAAETVVRHGFREGIITPREQFSYRPPKTNREEALKFRQSRYSVTLVTSVEKRFRSIMDASGLMFDEPIPFLDIAEEGHKYASHLGVEITEKDLAQSIGVYNKTRTLLARLDDLRKNDPPALSGAEHMHIVVAGMSIPREVFNERLETLLPELEERQSGEPGRPRLMVVGGACDVPEFIRFIEDKGANIVADGLCFGMRHYRGLIDESGGDPLGAIAERYTSREPCPAVINRFDSSFQILKETITEWKIDGVVCARLKFCDHWAGRRKMLVDRLRHHEIPLLDLEREYNTVGSGQIGTRVQAFLEMLSG